MIADSVVAAAAAVVAAVAVWRVWQTGRFCRYDVLVRFVYKCLSANSAYLQ